MSKNFLEELDVKKRPNGLEEQQTPPKPQT